MWTWHEFSFPQDHKGMGGWINGFRLKHLKADLDSAILPIIVGHFLLDVAGNCYDWVAVYEESVRLPDEIYSRYKQALPQSVSVPLMAQVYALCYAAIVEAKGPAWEGTLHPAIV